MKYIRDYNEGDYCKGIYLCKSKQVLTAKNGKTYYSLILQDKTGVIDAKVFDINSGIDEFEALDYIDVLGQVSSYQGSPQWKLARIRKCGEGEYNIDDYMMASKYDRNEMYDELMRLASCVKNTYLRQLIDMFFVKDKDFIEKFKMHSAAKTVHHGFVGGLLQHTLGVAGICNYLSNRYRIIDKELVMTAALFHDVGKLAELSGFPANEYTDEGQLLGHIYMGAEMVGAAADKIPNFPERLKTELIHCILAHHGELEFGSPKKPALIEAFVLNMADNTDAKIQIFTESFDLSGGRTDWLGFNKMLDSNIRRTYGTKGKE